MSNAVTTQKGGNVVEMSSPMALIESAVTQGANVETLEKLMLLQERYEANNARKEFFKAMQEFQSIKPELKRSNSVSFGQGKTAYNFCPLSDIERALKDPLTQCDLSYRFENCHKSVESKEGNVVLTGIKCIVSHVSGHSEFTEMYAPADGSGNKNAIQGIGSTSTYLMRYTLIAAFGLTTADEDNDGQTNSDLPYQRVLRQNELLRDVNMLKVVADIKESLAEDDYETVVGYMTAMPEETKTALWLAPTRGGIFSTKEISQMKSNEFAAARVAYFQERNGDNDNPDS